MRDVQKLRQYDQENETDQPLYTRHFKWTAADWDTTGGGWPRLRAGSQTDGPRDGNKWQCTHWDDAPGARRLFAAT